MSSGKFRCWLASNWSEAATLVMAFGVLASAILYVGAVSSKVDEESRRMDRVSDKIRSMEAEQDEFKRSFSRELQDMHDKISHIDQWVKDRE